MTGEPPPDSTQADVPTRTLSGGAVGAAAPRRIGNYIVVRVIASGGMGVVYEATQERPRRTVALKVMKHDVESRTALRRFEFESQVLAKLRHPGIAQIFEAGMHDDGAGPVPFFAMEYVANARMITQYAHEQRLDVAGKLQLFAKVCDAVHHGHLKGIIHRDLKPGNILIDGDGNAKVIDFGVARPASRFAGADSDPALIPSHTGMGELVGTLQYMSPEQFQAEPHDLDTRSDVYALGVVLHELLAGRLPYDLKDTPFYEVPRVIREAPAPRLSRYDRTLRGDLETIVSKALEKDRTLRYGSAQELRADLIRFLRREPIQARPIGIGYRALRFVQRKRRAVTGAAILVAIAIPAAWSYVDARRASAEALRREVRTAASREFLARLLERGVEDERAIIEDCNRAIEAYADLAAPFAIRAKMLARQGEREAARRDCRTALSIDPAHSLALRTLAFLQLEDGEFERARESFRLGTRTLWLDDYLPEDFHNRARLWRMIGQYDRALRDHNRAVALAPDSSIVYQGRGITNYLVGNLDPAIQDWSQAAKIDGNAAAQCALWIWEARTLRNQEGDRDAARAALESIPPAALTHPLAQAVVEYVLDEGTPDRLAAVAPTPADRCQMHYYVGAHALVRGQTAEALSRFRLCLSTNASTQPEYDLAAWRLAQLERE